MGLGLEIPVSLQYTPITKLYTTSVQFGYRIVWVGHRIQDSCKPPIHSDILRVYWWLTVGFCLQCLSKWETNPYFGKSHIDLAFGKSC